MWAPLIVSAAAGGGLVGTLAYGVKGLSAQVFGPSIYRGPGRRKSVALTFDDGPSEGTLPLIEYLAKEHVRGTFFQCGMNVLRLPAIARAVYSAGHEIGNHTFSHIRLCPRFGRKLDAKSPAVILQEFAQTQEVIHFEMGATPTLLRAPYGLRWYGLRAAQKQLSLLGVMWTVIGHDWEWPAAKVASLVLRKASAGGIVCLHDGRDIQPNPDVSEMLAAVKEIVPRLKDQGYSFETVSEIARPDPA